jgi:hypothetical protein
MPMLWLRLFQRPLLQDWAWWVIALLFAVSVYLILSGVQLATPHVWNIPSERELSRAIGQFQRPNRYSPKSSYIFDSDDAGVVALRCNPDSLVNLCLQSKGIDAGAMPERAIAVEYAAVRNELYGGVDNIVMSIQDGTHSVMSYSESYARLQKFGQWEDSKRLVSSIIFRFFPALFVALFASGTAWARFHPVK